MHPNLPNSNLKGLNQVTLGMFKIKKLSQNVLIFKIFQLLLKRPITT